MEKGVRLRIGSKYPDLLPLSGLTPSEHAGRQRWAKVPAAQKQVLIDAAKERLKRLRSQQDKNS
jgi:hypothetical protein